MSKTERIAHRHKKNLRERMPSSATLKGRRCAHCGTTESLTWDHILPIAEGGTNSRHNLQALCKACNQAKGANLTKRQQERVLS